LLIVAAATVAILQSVIAPFGMSVFTSYVIAAAAQLWLGRRDRLFARWALIALLAIHALALLIGVISTVIGSTGPDVVPPIISLFGFIYFEAIVFAIGSAVSLHALIKERNEAVISTLARTDGLTGIANRAVLLEKIEDAAARLRRYGNRFTVFMLDLDLFKTVNDSLGHPVGDELLKVVADRLSVCIRETDAAARLGGDEFAILATADGDQRQTAIAMASRLLEAVAAPYDLDGHHINIGTSIGIALAPEHGTDVAQLVKNADLALYKAKSEGRDAYRFFEDAMGVEARTRRATRSSCATHWQTTSLSCTIIPSSTSRPGRRPASRRLSVGNIPRGG